MRLRLCSPSEPTARICYPSSMIDGSTGDDDDDVVKLVVNGRIFSTWRGINEQSLESNIESGSLELLWSELLDRRIRVSQ